MAYGKRKYRGKVTYVQHRASSVLRRVPRSSYSKRARTGRRVSAVGVKTGRSKSFVRYAQRRMRRPRSIKSLKPSWFTTMTKTTPPADVAGNFGCVLKNAINTTNYCTVFKNLSMLDIQNALDFTAEKYASNSASVPSVNTAKCYISDVIHNHKWKNNSTAGSAHVSFYCLHPRERIPVNQLAATLGTALKCAPSGGYQYSTGGIYVGDLTQAEFFGDPIAEEPQPTGAPTNGELVSYPVTASKPVSTEWSPYWSQVITSNFKITRLKVKGPSGLKSTHVLKPGEEVTYTGKRMKPFMTSYNKFYMAAHGASPVFNIWQLIKETPLIFMTYHGGVGHDPSDASATGSVGMSAVHLDYFQQWKTKLWQIKDLGKYQWNPTDYTTTPDPTFTGISETPVVTAALTAVTTA